MSAVRAILPLRTRLPVNSLSSKSAVAVLFSGGLDSSILLAALLAQRQRVVPLYVDCELHWQAAELQAARRFLQAVKTPELGELVVLKMPLADLYEDHWSLTGRGVPSDTDPDELVYLPGRNPLLLVKADLWCRLHEVKQLALGSLASNPFADSTDAFFVHFEAAMNQAVPGQVQIVRPLAGLDKRQVMRLGREMPLGWTFSCLSPTGGLHCGGCNKCAERQQAFRLAELEDPTPYATARRVAI
jgi:7-cyano-7-deazaguanine synthase